MLQFSLDDIKKHLNIDSNFMDDDMYLLHLAQMAKEIVERDIDCPLEEFKNQAGMTEHGLRHAMLLLIGNMYANRESIAYGSAVEIPYGYKYIINLYVIQIFMLKCLQIYKQIYIFVEIIKLDN